MFPKSADDDRLLSDVLKMFNHAITDSHPVAPDDFLGWLAHVIMRPDSAITSLLHVRDEPGNRVQTESKRYSKVQMRMNILRIICAFVTWDSLL